MFEICFGVFLDHNINWIRLKVAKKINQIVNVTNSDAKGLLSFSMRSANINCHIPFPLIL